MVKVVSLPPKNREEEDKITIFIKIICMSDRITEADIDKAVVKKFEGHYKKPYDGYIPENIKEMFEKALMEISFDKFNLVPSKVEEMLNTPVYELNRIQFGLMMNIIMAVPIKHIYNSLPEAIEGMKPISKAMAEYNASVEQLSKEMAIEKHTRMKLANLTSSSARYPNGNFVLGQQ